MKGQIIISFSLALVPILCWGQRVDSTAFEAEKLRTQVVRPSVDVGSVIPDSIGYNPDLASFHLYHPKNAESVLGFDLGNNGSQLQTFSPFRRFGFEIGLDNFQPYALDFDRLNLFFARKAFSRARYVGGSKRENLLDVDLTSKFGKLLFAGFHFDRIRSLGYYSRQEAQNTEIDLFVGFRSKDHRYKSLLQFGWNTITNLENGGIANDSLFESNSNSSREFIPVNLEFAERRVKEFGLKFQQGFILSRVGLDSAGILLDTTEWVRKFNKVRLTHNLEFRRQNWVYQDVPDTSFYDQILKDSLVTIDSTALLSVRNELGFQLVRLKRDSSGHMEFNPWVGGFVAHEYSDALIDTIGLVNHSFSVGGRLDIPIRKVFRLRADAEVGLLGYNQGDVLVNGRMTLDLGKLIIDPYVKFALQAPVWKSQIYSSNNFSWANSFSKENKTQVGLELTVPNWKTVVDASYYLLGNLVYYDSTWTPTQSASLSQLIRVNLHQPLAYKWFHFDVSARTDLILSGEALSLPQFNGRASLYYENRLFRRRLKLQVGMDVWYHTSYQANSFIPALSEFARSAEKRIGNYPYLDVWISFQRKKLSFFFMVQHWNAGLMGTTYYSHLHYPVNDLGIKFGVDWNFLD